MDPMELALAYCFELWPNAIIRTARKIHHCDYGGGDHAHNIYPRRDYFDSGEMNIDAANPFYTNFRYCMLCVTEVTAPK